MMAPAATRVRTRDHDLDVNGLHLHVRETGEPDASPVLLLHGMMGHAREWDVLVDALADRFRVLALDQRGHGESDHADDYTIDSLVSDVREVMGRFDVERAHLIGHSMGGMVGILLAAGRPSAIDRLTIIDVGPPSLATTWGTQELPVILETLAAARYQTPEQALAEWLAGDPLASEPLLRHYVRHCLKPDTTGRWRWRFDAARLAGFSTSITEERLWQALDRVEAPTLLVRGEHSHLLTSRTAERMAHRLRDARLVQIPDGGHDLGVQQPRAVASAVRGFLTAQ